MEEVFMDLDGYSFQYPPVPLARVILDILDSTQL
jgi:hypothetical protein